MLQRVLEPEVMDSAEEADDYDRMDHAQVNAVFVSDFLADWDQRGPILDVGTGTALIPLELCRRAPAAEVVGIDLAAHMIQVGRQNIRRAGLGQQIRLEHCDAKEMPFATGLFGAVISNSIVHHIPEPLPVLQEMVRVASPGGVIFVRDLLRPATDAEVGRLVDLHARQANAHQLQMFEASLRAALTLNEVRDLVASLGHGPEEVRQSSDRHWTWQTRKAGKSPSKTD